MKLISQAISKAELGGFLPVCPGAESHDNVHAAHIILDQEQIDRILAHMGEGGLACIFSQPVLADTWSGHRAMLEGAPDAPQRQRVPH